MDMSSEDKVALVTGRYGNGIGDGTINWKVEKRI